MHVRRLSAHRHLVARRLVWRLLRGACGLALLVLVKTVTITEAKKHLGAYLKQATAGTNIGIICGHHIIALRPVEVTSVDFEEVGDPELTAKLTPEQRDLLYAQLKKERKEAKRRRKELLSGAEPAP
jgi:antitoxin (DNA-binding transcriptional repressor) of toxin-antitoxin stability system